MMKNWFQHPCCRIAGGQRSAVVLLVLAMAGAPLFAADDTNGAWTPEKSRDANRPPSEPKDPRGWYPPIDPANKPDPAPQSEPASPTTVPESHYTPPDTNGAWTPEKSRDANRPPSEPQDPRGWYPPAGPPGKPSDLGDDLGDLGSKIATSELANPLIQGGKAIGRTYEAAESGDLTRVTIETADGVGRLTSIGEGVVQGAALGTLYGGPLGGFVGGLIGGFLGKTAWDNTGGRLNDYSRKTLDQLQAGPQGGRPPGAGNNAGSNSGGSGPPPGANHQGTPQGGRPPVVTGGSTGSGPPPGGTHQDPSSGWRPPVSTGGSGSIPSSGSVPSSSGNCDSPGGR